MFDKSNRKIQPFANKVWLSTPTMHGPELKYMTEAFETNWMSTVGNNINVIEKQVAELIGVKYAIALSCGTSTLHLAMKLAGEHFYGQPRTGDGAVQGRKVICCESCIIGTTKKKP